MSSEKGKKKTNAIKAGVYICHCGGNISDHVDVDKVREQAEKIEGVAIARTNMFMCSDPGQELIQQDLTEGKINRVVVASCAPSLHELTFRGAIKRAGHNPYLYEHANIREQGSWVHHGEAATKKATALISAAVAKASLLTPLEPIRVDAINHATVIGGGIAGMRAALDLAKKGVKVAIIEKTPFLGGNLASLDSLAPFGEKAEDILTAIVPDILSHKNIVVYTCARVTGFQGYVGNFRLTVTLLPSENMPGSGIKTGDFIFGAGIAAHGPHGKESVIELETGAIIMATGFKSYTPAKGEYGFLDHAQIITLPDMIEKLANNPAKKDFLYVNGEKIRHIAFIHCVGSRQIPGIHEPGPDGHLNEYCSRTCCTTVLHTEVMIRERFPNTRVFDFYRDIRTYGRGQEAIYEKASKLRTTFFRFNPEDSPSVSGTNGKFPLKITVKDTLTFGEEIDVPVDLIVLATGVIPTPIKELVQMMKLPLGADRFLQEVHPKLRPVELANTGILLAGTCQAPMDVGEACNAAQAAAAKTAILLTKGYVELDPYVARVNKERCDGTGACIRACPIEGAIRIVESNEDGKSEKRAEIIPAMCTGCGICVAVCPNNAMDIQGWELGQYEAMVDAIVAAA